MHWPMVTNDTCDTQGLLFSLTILYKNLKMDTTTYWQTYPTN